MGKLKGVGDGFVDEGTGVAKIGRTTGRTAERVTAFEIDNVTVRFDIGDLRFDNQIEIEGEGAGPFSDGGDSGSLIVGRDLRGVALLFAGSDQGGASGQASPTPIPSKRCWMRWAWSWHSDRMNEGACHSGCDIARHLE